MAEDGPSALAAARRHRPDLVVLDIMLPGIDGLQVCRMLRAESVVPILVLSAKGEEIDRVVGLEVGADDYLTKPFAMRELLARVQGDAAPRADAGRRWRRSAARCVGELRSGKGSRRSWPGTWRSTRRGGRPRSTARW